jgi:hypothetical protein
MCSGRLGHADHRQGLLGLERVIGGAAAIRAAAEAGVLGLLADGGASPRQVADRLGLYEPATRRILDALVALGLAARGLDGTYTSEVEEPALLDGYLQMWDSLPGVLRHGRALFRLDSPADAQHFYPDLVGSLGRV